MTHFEDKGECFELIFLIYHSQEHIATPDALARLFVPQVFRRIIKLKALAFDFEEIRFA